MPSDQTTTWRAFCAVCEAGFEKETAADDAPPVSFCPDCRGKRVSPGVLTWRRVDAR